MQSPAQRCATDILAVTFSYLPLFELAIAVRTCKHWRDAEAKEPARMLTLVMESSSAVGAVGNLPSMLHRHINKVECELPLHADSMDHLRKLPRLTQLTATIDFPGALDHINPARARQLDALIATLPRGLKTLRMQDPLDLPTLNSNMIVFDALVVLDKLETLDLTAVFNEAEGFSHGDIKLDPLLRMPRLTHLDLGSMPLTLTRATALGKLVYLEILDWEPANWGVEFLEVLCRQEGGLQRLKELSLRQTRLTADHMTELVRLRSLEVLTPLELGPDAIPFLPRLPCLYKVAVWHADVLYPAITSAECRAALRACQSLTSIHMDPTESGEGHGSDVVPPILLQNLPLLRSVNFSGYSISSLHCLRHLRGLTDLTLFDCQVDRQEVMRLGELAPQLTKLRLIAGTEGHLTAADLLQLTPPSSLLTHLSLFKYGNQEEEQEALQEAQALAFEEQHQLRR